MSNLVGLYSVDKFPDQLPRIEEKKYLQLASNGDEYAKNKLCEHNLRLVMYILGLILKRLNISSFDEDDLFASGIDGLMKAINTFKIEKKVMFSTYAARCISNEIFMSLRKCKHLSHIVSLDEVLHKNAAGNNLTLADLLPSNEYVDEAYSRAETYNELMMALSSLTEIEKKVLMMLNGFECKKMTKKGAAEVLGIQLNYVKKANKKAKKKMLAFLKNRGLGMAEDTEVISRKDDHDINDDEIKPNYSKIIKIRKSLLEIFSSYSEGQIKKALEQLIVEEKNLILLWYPLSNEKQCSINEITNRYNMSYEKMKHWVESIINKIMDILSSQNIETEPITEKMKYLSKPKKSKI